MEKYGEIEGEMRYFTVNLLFFFSSSCLDSTSSSSINLSSPSNTSVLIDSIKPEQPASDHGEEKYGEKLREK